MADGIDLQRLQGDWQEMEDPDRAAAHAVAFFEAIRTGRLDPVPLLSEMEEAAEPAWDAGEGDPRLVVHALLAAEPAFRAAEANASLTSPNRLYLRARFEILLARAWHRYPHPAQAFALALDAIRWLEGFVEGHKALADVISRPANPVAEQAVAALGIYPAALRRSGLSEDRKLVFAERGLRLVEAYLRRNRGGIPAIYPRTSALAAQWLYYGIEHGIDNDLIAALFRLDNETRPANRRGAATRSLRDMEFARHTGDADAVERYRLAAVSDLARFRLARHQQVVEQHSYLAAAS